MTSLEDFLRTFLLRKFMTVYVNCLSSEAHEINAEISPPPNLTPRSVLLSALY